MLPPMLRGDVSDAPPASHRGKKGTTSRRRAQSVASDVIAAVCRGRTRRRLTLQSEMRRHSERLPRWRRRQTGGSRTRVLRPPSRERTRAPVKQPSHAKTSNVEHIDLAQVLDFRPDQGIIRLARAARRHPERGRHGPAAQGAHRDAGARDGAAADAAVWLRRRVPRCRQPARPIAPGRARWKGFAPARCFTGSKASSGPRSSASNTTPRQAGSRRKCVWHDSYVAEQHLHHYGKSDAPVCWSLVGYASGYASACLGQEIYFRETECLAQGARDAARSSARDADELG